MLTMVLSGLVSLVVFLVVLSVLVIVHELGHFLTARKFGVGVWEFALGLPFTKPLWSKKLSSGMAVSIYPLLFGGFVRMLGEEGHEGAVKKSVNSVPGKQFYSMPVLQRMVIVVSGVAMNLLFAVLLFYVFLLLNNFRVLVPRFAPYKFISPSEDLVVIVNVSPKSPAGQAGLKFGDVVLAADGKKFSVSGDFQKYIREQAGKPIQLELTNQDFTTARTVSVTPRINPPYLEGPLGVGIGQGIVVAYKTPAQKLVSGVEYAADMLVYNLKVLVHFVSEAKRTGNYSQIQQGVSGPIGIAVAVDQILKQPKIRDVVVAMVNFTAILSVSLAFINILPFPAMDGGRLAFLIVELVFKKRIPVKYEAWINQIGFVLILGLFILVSYSDIRVRLLGW